MVAVRMQIEAIEAESKLQDLVDAFGAITSIGDVSGTDAFELARALGDCRLFGVEPGQLDGTLPAHIAVAAIRHLRTEMFQEWNASVRSFLESVQRGSDWDEQSLLSDGVTIPLMDGWAAWVAIDEAYEDCLIREEVGFAEFKTEFWQAHADFYAWHDTVAAQLAKPLAHALAGTFLLKNWRQTIADHYYYFLPWWLNGSLEGDGSPAELVL